MKLHVKETAPCAMNSSVPRVAALQAPECDLKISGAVVEPVFAHYASTSALDVLSNSFKVVVQTTISHLCILAGCVLTG